MASAQNILEKLRIAPAFWLLSAPLQIHNIPLSRRKKIDNCHTIEVIRPYPRIRIPGSESNPIAPLQDSGITGEKLEILKILVIEILVGPAQPAAKVGIDCAALLREIQITMRQILRNNLNIDVCNKCTTYFQLRQNFFRKKNYLLNYKPFKVMK